MRNVRISMKAGTANLIKRYGYGAAVLLAIGGCAVAAYLLFFKPQIPECRAVEHLTDNVAGRTIERVLLISLVPDGRRQLTVLLNGRIADGKDRYVVERALVMDYQRQGNNYSLLVKENIKKSQDNVERADLNRRLPEKGQRLHLRIEQIDSRHFLVADNHAPFYVCVAP
ncbi:Uncharacterised protein [Serratia ficaria]|nr:Uncharacterised protein [Serratia ficaria]